MTGGAGWFGRDPVPYLVARGFDVHAVDRRHRPACPPGATYHRVDILKRGFDDVQKVIFASRATGGRPGARVSCLRRLEPDPAPQRTARRNR